VRLNLTFIVLLLTASTATSLVWQNFTAARDGDPVGRVMVFVGVPVALASVVLLGRIVTKVNSPRPGRRGR
jgi:choline-glycine betaine transporter